MIISKSYTFETSKIEEDLRIIQLADAHINEATDWRKLKKYLEKIQKKRPDYIIFNGDLKDATAPEDINEFCLEFLARLAKETSGKLIFTLGNHEIMQPKSIDLADMKNTTWEEIRNSKLVREIQKLTNVVTLNNQIYYDEYNNLAFWGINPGFDSYQFGRDNSDLYKTINEKLPSYPMLKDAFNIAVCHHPDILKEDITSKLDFHKYIDLYTTAHNHYGFMPAYIGFLITYLKLHGDKNAGLYGQPLSRGLVDASGVPGIIGGQMTALAETTKNPNAHTINNLCQSRMDEIILKKVNRI